ncbi:nucleotide exchange factor GrpE [Marichromatium bheemlicum]|uniref:Protein GrpE n=1 Tax=Marichromatium bheemlicum TaxID=365339 RepID=A0ABX1I9Q1_9GAMM|nr:nucleotide exchange factor GrpE [Marichromatium bheemlicum]NKN33551.1 nucleotide exchange factor GrpE [Marichromatium bheemlicum]
MNPEQKRPEEQPEQPAQGGEDAVHRAAVSAYAETAAESEPRAAEPMPEDEQEATATPEEQAAAPSIEELSAALTEARAEAEALREQLRDQLLRARAEAENLKRRHANELEKAHKFALDGFVRELLGVRDSLELGYLAAQDEGADVAKLREGTALTLKLLGDVMDKFGVGQVDPIDQPFDPEFHQAMSMQPREDVAPNTVVEVIQKGYTLNGRLVRPALVLVSQQPA